MKAQFCLLYKPLRWYWNITLIIVWLTVWKCINITSRNSLHPKRTGSWGVTKLSLFLHWVYKNKAKLESRLLTSKWKIFFMSWSRSCRLSWSSNETRSLISNIFSLSSVISRCRERIFWSCSDFPSSPCHFSTSPETTDTIPLSNLVFQAKDSNRIKKAIHSWTAFSATFYKIFPIARSETSSWTKFGQDTTKNEQQIDSSFKRRTKKTCLFNNNKQSSDLYLYNLFLWY